MQEKNEIGKISFDFDKSQLEIIANTGKLGNFVENATELFKQALKAELVNRVSSGSVSLARFGDYEFGSGGPIGPFPHVFAELDALTKRISNIEVLVKRG